MFLVLLKQLYELYELYKLYKLKTPADLAFRHGFFPMI